jgi:hypothetical protein
MVFLISDDSNVRGINWVWGGAGHACVGDVKNMYTHTCSSEMENFKVINNVP